MATLFTVFFKCLYTIKQSFNLKSNFKLKTDPKMCTFKNMEKHLKIKVEIVKKNKKQPLSLK